MSALDAESFESVSPDGDQVEISVEHTPEQTLVAVELEHANVVAAVDVGDIAVTDSTKFGRDLQAAVRDLVSGGDA